LYKLITMTRITMLQLIYDLTSISLVVYIHPLFLMMFIITFFFIVVDSINCDFNSASFFSGLFHLTKIKRIHTHYGRFYIIIRKGDMIYLYQDKLFYLKYISHNNYQGVERSKEWIKEEYDVIYFRKRAKDEITNQLKSWNGYIDIQTERDKKLDKIL